MLITREADYAMRMIRALRNEELMTMDEICRQELVPKQFAYKILKKLKNAGLIQIRRGAKGGCTLARPADRITLYDIIVSINKDISVARCLLDGVACENRERAGICTVYDELKRIQNLLEEELKRYSFKELMEERTYS